MRYLTCFCALTLLMLLSPACGGGGGGGEDPREAEKPIVTVLGPDLGVSIQQVDFYAPGGDQPGSTWGRLVMDPDRLSAMADLRGGFVSVVTAKGWAVVNVPMPEENEPRQAIYFDLGLDSPELIDTTEVAVMHSDVGMADVRPHLGELIPFPVDVWVSRAHGLGDWPDLERVIPPQEPPYTISLLDTPRFQLPTFSNLQTVVNIECAVNQCFPMAVANSLWFLRITGAVGLPNGHVSGIGVPADPTFNTLVGQLDHYANREVTSRTSGSGVWFSDMIDGTFEYLEDAGLDGVVSFRHQDRGYSKPISAGDYTSHRITSQDDGAAITWQWINDRIIGGCGVLIVYRAHAVRVTGSGMVLGMPWIRYSHDDNQTNDRSGLESVITFLSDPDGDGLLNMDGTDREIRWAWAACP